MTDARTSIRAIVVLIAGEAARRGRRWDPQGLHAAILAAINDDRRPIDQVILAGFAEAADPNATTPAGIRNPDHYPPTQAATHNARPATCAVCKRSEDECRRAETPRPARDAPRLPAHPPTREVPPMIDHGLQRPTLRPLPIAPDPIDLDDDLPSHHARRRCTHFGTPASYALYPFRYTTHTHHTPGVGASTSLFNPAWPPSRR